MLTACGSNAETGVHSTKRERNSIKEGTPTSHSNALPMQKYHIKALEENPDNATAQFNLASSYIKQRGNDVANKADSLIRTADAILTSVSEQQNIQLAQKAYYDRGNLAYKAEDYAAAIEHYKNALRRNPDDDIARENLRLAQLKKQEQDKNQDQNQNQDNQQQNQDQNQDKQDQKQNEDQQNQDKNQDKNNQQDQQNQQNSPQQDQKDKEQKQQQGGLSDASAQQILKAMEDKENGTRQKVELMKQGEEKRANRRTTDKPW